MPKPTSSFEWYTPAPYVAAAAQVMGGIDLDPASCAIAQKTVQAYRYYDQAANGLDPENPWEGRVWLNPPYAASLIRPFVARLVSEYLSGRVTQAVLLTNNATDTAWFDDAMTNCGALCFPKGRIRFARPGGTSTSPTQGQSFFFFGPKIQKFASVFSKFGHVVVAYPR